MQLIICVLFLQRSYVAYKGLDVCRKDDQFWLHFEDWKEQTFGRGPSEPEMHRLIQTDRVTYREE